MSVPTTLSLPHGSRQASRPLGAFSCFLPQLLWPSPSLEENPLHSSHAWLLTLCPGRGMREALG